MFSNCKNSKKQGVVGLGAAIYYFTSNGYTVCVPLNDSQDYDLVVDNGVNLLKVQVKTTKHKAPSGNYVVNLRVCGGNSKQNYVHKSANQVVYDLLFVICNNGDKYLIPKAEICGIRECIVFSSKYKKFKVG